MRTLATAVSVLLLALTATGCDTAGEVRDAAQEVAEDVADATGEVRERAEEVAAVARFCTAALRTAQAARSQDWDGAVTAAEEAAAAAPDDVREDVQVVLDGAISYRDGHEQTVDDAEFRAAAERVETYTRDRCDPRD